MVLIQSFGVANDLGITTCIGLVIVMNVVRNLFSAQ